MIILFDVDGTLTQSAQKISTEMLETLNELRKKDITLGLVGGGTFEKIRSQVLNSNIFKYIFAESGAIVYVDCVKVSEKNMLEYCDIKVLNEIKNKARTIIDSFQHVLNQTDQKNKVCTIPEHTKKMDQRKGLLYISIPGIDATIDERQQFIKIDNQMKLRNYIMDELKKVDYGESFEILTGGQVGISVSPKGFDKSQAISFLRDNKKYDITKKDTKNIYFFGDKVELGGNDYHIYNHDKVCGIKVENYYDTINKLKNMFLQ